MKAASLLFALVLLAPPAGSTGGSKASSHAARGAGAVPFSALLSGSGPALTGIDLRVGRVDTRLGAPLLPGVVIPVAGQTPGLENARAPLARAAAPGGPEAERPSGQPDRPAEAASEQAREALPVAQARESAEQETAAGQAAFDGGSKKRASAESWPALRRLAASKYSFLLPPGLAHSLTRRGGSPTPPRPPKRPNSRDIYGGPAHQPMNVWQRVAYGANWGLNLLGVSSLLSLTLRPLLAATHWQLHLPAGVLDALGRVELMTNMGPMKVSQALSYDPLGFLFFSLPVSSAWEEFVYRGLTFGFAFLALAAVRPMARFFSDALLKVPDLFGFGSMARALLGDGPRAAASKALPREGIQRLSGMAFSLAAGWAAVRFGMAHFGAWGADPFILAVHGTLGFGLTYAAYRSRSLLSSSVAHFVLNALPLAGIAVAIALGSSAFAQVYTVGLALFSIGWLIRSWLRHRGASGGGGGPAALLGLVLAASLGLSGLKTASEPARRASSPQAAVQAPSLKSLHGKPVAPLPTDTAAAPAPLTLAQITAQAKPAIPRIVIETAMGKGFGTGFIVRADGLLATNNHVAVRAGLRQNVRVEFPDGAVVLGVVVALNAERDIAFIQLPTREGGWPVLPIADKADIREGDEVLAFGYPLGLPFSVSYGVISGIGAGRGDVYVEMMQTDAALNGGNSGGPLLNRSGKVVGINSSILPASADGGFIGVGFTIPADALSAALAQYQATGDINSSYLGVIVDAQAPIRPAAGVLIEHVRPSSPAARAGLQSRDIVVGAGGTAFTEGLAIEQLAKALSQARPGSRISLSIARQDRTLDVTIVLGDRSSPK